MTRAGSLTVVPSNAGINLEHCSWSLLSIGTHIYDLDPRKLFVLGNSERFEAFQTPIEGPDDHLSPLLPPSPSVLCINKFTAAVASSSLLATGPAETIQSAPREPAFHRSSE